MKKNKKQKQKASHLIRQSEKQTEPKAIKQEASRGCETAIDGEDRGEDKSNRAKPQQLESVRENASRSADFGFPAKAKLEVVLLLRVHGLYESVICIALRGLRKVYNTDLADSGSAFKKNSLVSFRGVVPRSSVWTALSLFLSLSGEKQQLIHSFKIE